MPVKPLNPWGIGTIARCVSQEERGMGAEHTPEIPAAAVESAPVLAGNDFVVALASQDCCRVRHATAHRFDLFWVGFYNHSTLGLVPLVVTSQLERSPRELRSLGGRTYGVPRQ